MEKIFCNTNEERDKVLQRLEDMGYLWSGNKYKTTKLTSVYDAPMTIYIDNDKMVTQSFLNDRKEFGATEWLEKELKPKYKVGDLFQIKPNVTDLTNSMYLSLTSRMIDRAGSLVTLVSTVFDRISRKQYLCFKEVGGLWSEDCVNPIKEVKRPAKVGEFVKVTNPDNYLFNEYKFGDILKVVDYIHNLTCYKKEDGKFLYEEEYVVLEGYEDCNYVKKFEEKFVPYLEFYASNYGIIGEDTNIIDAVGRRLRIGDTVEIYHYGEYLEESTIVKNQAKNFVMGICSFCNPDGSIRNDYKIIKKRSYKEINDREVVHDIRYVKSKK